MFIAAITILLCIAVSLYVVLPLFQPITAEFEQEGDYVVQAALQDLRDGQLDVDLGRLSPEMFDQMREEKEQQIARQSL